MKIPAAGRIVAALALLALLFGLYPGRAWALKYKPMQGENLAEIARKHYGDEKKSIYISASNDITDPRRYQGRKTLYIPTVWKYRFKSGDDIEQLAEKYFKTARRADYLMWLNHIKKPGEIKDGMLLTMPFVLRHRARTQTTMKTISRLYYWSDKHALRLREFNGKRDNQVRAGEVIEVPIFDPQAQTGRVRARMRQYLVADKPKTTKTRERTRRPLVTQPDAEAMPVADSRPEEQPEVVTVAKSQAAEPAQANNGSAADEAVRDILGDSASRSKDESEIPPEIAALLTEARTLYKDGAYELARATLVRVLEHEDIPRVDEAEARELMAFCLVALDRKQQAEHEFVRLLMVSPDHKLDPATTSPKILKIFNKANGLR